MEVGPFGLVLSGRRGVCGDGFAEEEASGQRAWGMRALGLSWFLTSL